MSKLNVNQIRLTFGEKPLFRRLSLQLQEGEIGVVIGTSGEGKTTLLRCIAGLQGLDRGEVLLDSKQVKGPDKRLIPGHDEIQYVAQQAELMPMLSARENIHQGALHLLDKQKKAKAEELLRTFALGKVADQQLKTLSGGQQQRVSLAKALAKNYSLYLFDEVFSQLDFASKTRVMVRLRRYLKKEGKTALFVVHDPLDAFFLADTIYVLQRGRIVQEGKAIDVQQKPANLNVARLFGQVNVLSASKAEELFPGNKFKTMRSKKWFWPQDVKIDQLATPYKLQQTITLQSGTIHIVKVRGKELWLT